ncbi:MAG: hypothetical protein ISP55_02900 [Flavobacteriales bacterium]|nr:hypothetical protein [Flavobacteriales bacterium]
MRCLLKVAIVLAPLLWSFVSQGQSTPASSAPDDTSRTLSIDLFPQRMGGVGSSMPGDGGPLFQASAAARIATPKTSAVVAFDFVQGAGTPIRRALEAGFDRRGTQGNGASRMRLRGEWKPTPSLQLSAGRDTLHDGWGYRSLFRGRHTAPAAFLQTALDGGGRVRYRHRIEALQGARSIHCWTGADPTGDPQTWVPPSGTLRGALERMVVSHRLEVDFGQRLTAALWGTVVWNTEGGSRLFEPHYLIPLTSLRPTEYAQGSSDNALVGLEGQWRLGPKGTRHRYLYGQLLLDELIVSEILGSTGWWGNKYGLLGGVHWGYPRGAWRIELTGVRPWTYSHYTATSAYINGLTPVAHPLGANFMEGSLHGRMERGPWALHGRLTASRRGDAAMGEVPTGSLPQVGDIDRTFDTYAWLNGRNRDFLLVQLDVARHFKVGGNTTFKGFLRLEHGRTSHGPDLLTENRLVFGLRTTGPFLGADW